MICNITNIRVLEFRYSRIAPPTLEIKYVLTDDLLNGYGQGTRNTNFSPETLERLEQLLISMEADVRKDLFKTTEDSSDAIGSGEERAAATVDDVPGF